MPPTLHAVRTSTSVPIVPTLRNDRRTTSELHCIILISLCDFVLNAGRQYDKDGNLRQWWNNGTIRAFRERAQCIIDQYSDYVLEPLGMHVSTADN